MTYSQLSINKQALAQPEQYWGHQAKQIAWTRQPSSALRQEDTEWTWFPDGEMNMCYEAIDRNVNEGLGPSPAIIWDSPVTGLKDVITYADLLGRVQIFAGVLSSLGVVKGDVVMIYMPMIPEALVAMYACARLGAIHSVVFGGFAAKELAKRIDSATPKVLLTASVGIEEKRVTQYIPLVVDALSYAQAKPEHTIVYQRPNHTFETTFLDWESCIAKATPVKECTPTGARDILYTLYTSGTTGAPKGVSRFAPSYAVHLKHSIKSLMNLNPRDVMFCASDIGWVVGHTYIVYAPLLGGCTTVLFEGKVPMRQGTEVWRVCEQWCVNVLFCAPTALRALRTVDPEHKEMKKRNLKRFRNLMLAGERSEPSIVQIYADVLGVPVIDNYWSSESGSPITGILQSQTDKPRHKPGSAGPPTPGYDLRIVDDNGKPVQGEGNIVLGLPLPPSMLQELWRDTNNRFKKSYMTRFPGYFDTGDAGRIDEDGFVHILSRSDDIINVAAHRLSTGSFEAVIATVPGVQECCVVGMPDALKGHVPVAFIVATTHPSFDEINARVRAEIGNIASLAGMIELKTSLPKTRSGKTVRMLCRAYLENAYHGVDKNVAVPATIEDASVLEPLKAAISQFVKARRAKL